MFLSPLLSLLLILLVTLTFTLLPSLLSMPTLPPTTIQCGGSSCSPSNSFPQCVNMTGVPTCEVSSCLPLFGLCGGSVTAGCNVDLTTINDCGLCNHKCIAPSNGAAACTSYGLIYANGPDTGLGDNTDFSTVGGLSIDSSSANIVSDSFIFQSSNDPTGPLGDNTVDIDGVNLILWMSHGAHFTSAQLTIGSTAFFASEEYTDDFAIASTQNVVSANVHGYDIVDVYIPIYDLILDTNTTYYISLSNATTTVGSYVGWDVNNGPSSSQGDSGGQSTALSSHSFNIQSKDHVCSVGSCNSGYGDCNLRFSDGCEVKLSDNVNHCGSCSNDCTASTAAVGSNVSCVASSCVYTSYNGGSTISNVVVYPFTYHNAVIDTYLYPSSQIQVLIAEIINEISSSFPNIPRSSIVVESISGGGYSFTAKMAISNTDEQLAIANSDVTVVILPTATTTSQQFAAMLTQYPTYGPVLGPSTSRAAAASSITYCGTPGSNLAPCPASTPSSSSPVLSTTNIIIIAAAGGGGAFLLIVLLCWCCYRRRQSNNLMNPKGKFFIDSTMTPLTVVETSNPQRNSALKKNSKIGEMAGIPAFLSQDDDIVLSTNSRKPSRAGDRDSVPMAPSPHRGSMDSRRPEKNTLGLDDGGHEEDEHRKSYIDNPVAIYSFEIE